MIAVFRADASATLGGGHVMRCLTLADTLAGAGWRCGFACNGEAADVVPGVRRHDLLPLPPNADSVGLMRERWGDTWDLAVIDHYGLDAAFERALRPIASRILVIDDLHDRKHDCDFLLDQTLGRGETDYRGLIPPGCRMMMGTEYALLREQFPLRRDAALESRRSRSGRIDRVLVFFGATDPFNITSSALDALALSGWKGGMDVVLGKGAPYLDAIGLKITNKINGAVFHRGSDDMARLIENADLALGSPGTTSWERCCLGLPTVLIAFAENQREIAAGLGRAGAAVDLGWYEDVTVVDLAKSICDLAMSPDKVKKISDASAFLCDGMGSARVKEALGT